MSKAERNKMKTDADVTEKLMQLLSIRSVSGHTEAAMDIVRERFEKLNLIIRSTTKGSIIATLNGSTPEGIIFSAHLDTLGGMISGIEDDGRIRLRTIGSYTMSSIEGEYCKIETWDGDLFDGTVLYDNTSVHIHGLEKASEKRKNEEMYIRLDSEASSKKEILELGLSVGNYIHFDPRPVRTKSGFIKSRHLDDKAGVAILIEVAERLVREEITPMRTLHFLITSYEEVGHGAAGYLPENASEFIAVDMGVAGNGRESSESSVTICAADSTGPFNYQITKRLIKLAEANSIPFTVDTFPHYGSDAAAALKSGLDVKHGLIGPGVDASHANERTHEKALEATIDLIQAYVMS